MSDQKPVPPSGPKLTMSTEVALGHYANFVNVVLNHSEVLLDFGRTLPGHKEIPVVARIIMNPFHAKQLARVLNHNLQMYEKTFGPIPSPPEGPVTPPAPESTN